MGRTFLVWLLLLYLVFGVFIGHTIEHTYSLAICRKRDCIEPLGPIIVVRRGAPLLAERMYRSANFSS